MSELLLDGQNFHFLRPWVLAFLMPALFLYGLARWRARQNSLWGRIIKAEYLELLAVDSQGQAWLNPARLMLISCVIATLAAAGPSWQMKANPLQQSQQAIFLLLQLNASTEEGGDESLLRSKLKVQALMDAHKSIPMGVIVFSGSAHTVLPLSKDQQAIHLYLADLRAEIMPEDGFRPDLAFAELERQMDLQRYPRSSIIVVGNDETMMSPAALKPWGQSLLNIHWSTKAHKLDEVYQQQGFQQILMTNSPEDVHQISKLLKRQQLSQAQGEEDRWHDAGYLLLWPMLFLALLWFRRGMVLSWA
ncbi:hypothetical protein [Pseudoteredinibacter isoporae]|uniref:VWFA domain-containing protein n=1 Tax=Pseudoteredinibacter isoporae TaxID=570281 RepID=A0A7X0MUV5_9GAMM|nr:hypothetical protein [Pseudoteredinibacter isoporae]MBB6520698.1 hypothetical protein [Pseudoteredinibacter isoporae]NHO86265.1 hypothetical protein [Pseudoteredinibacter isoporae]NIB25284.1 hypothetical protein [Pseudoteredinibacter isoporae]